MRVSARATSTHSPTSYSRRCAMRLADTRSRRPEGRDHMTEDSNLARPDPCCFVLFGATGDLAHRLVIPALYNLAASGLLPDPFAIVGVARRDVSADDLRTRFHKGLRQFATQDVDDDVARRLFQRLAAVSADVEDEGSFERL